MIKNYQELSIEIDMLKGNINRMCVTDEIEELKTMYDAAMTRLNVIYNYNNSRINGEVT